MWVWLAALLAVVVADEVVTTDPTSFTVHGEISLPSARQCAKWSTTARVLLNNGQYVAFVHGDCSFHVDNVPSGSYIVQVENTQFNFEPIRVDVTVKGKMRARKLTILQPNSVNQVSYPLVLTPRGPLTYFRKREEWRATDVLMNPMVLMMALPLVLMFILPKMTANDPQLQKEMEQMQLPKMDVPDISEMMANLFSGGQPPKKKSTGSGAAIQRKK